MPTQATQWRFLMKPLSPQLALIINQLAKKDQIVDQILTNWSTFFLCPYFIRVLNIFRFCPRDPLLEKPIFQMSGEELKPVASKE